jgi:hypothetical protein
MSMEHSDDCIHCRMGCTHPHDPEDPVELDIQVRGPFVNALAVRGSRMRHGGVFTEPNTGLTLGTDEWRPIRCPGCGMEAMTPLEMVPPMCGQAEDGAYLGWCPGCIYDMSQGHRPGHGAHRRRRRRT